jgi:NitT/TauT family transport system substrate-binding protein
VRKAIPAAILVAAMAGTLASCSSGSHAASSSTAARSSVASTATSGPTASTSAQGTSGLANTPAPKPLPDMTNVTMILQAKTESWIVPVLAQSLGEFKKENLNVKIEYEAQPSDIILALNHGQADVAYLGTSALLLNSIASGANVRIVMDPSETPPGISGIYVKSSLVSNPATFNACQFKGMKVGIGPTLTGSVPAVALGTYLKQHCPSVNVSDVSLSPLSGATAYVALQTGALQAADLYAPSSSQANSTGLAKMVVPVPPGGGAMVMGSVLDKQPAVADAVVRALLRTQRTYLQGDYHANPKVVSVIADSLGEPASAVTSPQNPNLIFSPDGTFPAGYLATAQDYYLSLKPKILTYSTPLSAAQLVDEAPITAALGNG